MRKIYYGIEFPETFTVADYIKTKFAKLLFFHQGIPCESVKNLLSNSDLLQKISIVIEKFGCSISGIEPVGLEDADEMAEKQRLFGKLLQWVREFEFPTEDELRDFSNHHLIPLETIIMFLKITIEEDNFSRERILDFLLKYSDSLPQQRIDETLDLYNARTNHRCNEILELMMSNSKSEEKGKENND